MNELVVLVVELSRQVMGHFYAVRSNGKKVWPQIKISLIIHVTWKWDIRQKFLICACVWLAQSFAYFLRSSEFERSVWLRGSKYSTFFEDSVSATRIDVSASVPFCQQGNNLNFSKVGGFWYTYWPFSQSGRHMKACMWLSAHPWK